jgi:hypothetical protein
VANNLSRQYSNQVLTKEDFSMAPLPINTPPGLSGTIDVAVFDADGNPITGNQIWDRTLVNRLDTTIVLTGPFKAAYHNADSFQLVAYFDPQATGTVTQVPAAPVAFLGSTGTLTAAALTFAPPGVPSCSISVPASDPTLPAGPYRVTVVLSHTPTGGINPRVAGFFDMGIIQLY